MTDLPSYYSESLALAYPQCSAEQQRALRLLLWQACPSTLLRGFLRPHLEQKEPPASIIESIDLQKHFVYGNRDTIGLLPFLFRTVQSEKAIHTIIELVREVVGLRAEVMVDAELAGDQAVQAFATAETKEANDIVQENFPELKPKLAELFQQLQREKMQHEAKRKPRRGEPIH